MKKLISTILAVAMVMAMGVTAFAANGDGGDKVTTAGGTDVNVTASVEAGYEITIPSKLNLTKKDGTAENLGAATLAAGAHIAPGKQLKISVALKDGNLKHDADPENVTIGATLNNTSKIFTVDGNAETYNDWTITVTTDTWKSAKSGSYTGLLTYTVALEDVTK